MNYVSGYGQIIDTPTCMRVFGNLTQVEWEKERNIKRPYHDPKGMNVYKFTVNGEVVEEIRLPDLVQLATKIKLQKKYPGGQP